jgi:hypothetical protein
MAFKEIENFVDSFEKIANVRSFEPNRKTKVFSIFRGNAGICIGSFAARF